jgi:hypothetical protein
MTSEARGRGGDPSTRPELVYVVVVEQAPSADAGPVRDRRWERFIRLGVVRCSMMVRGKGRDLGGGNAP